MKPEPGDEGRRWVDQAKLDLDAARVMSGAGHHNHACFLSQQAAKKALKGFLYSRGAWDVHGHAVGGLCKDCAALEPQFGNVMPVAAGLDKFYIPTRYPNGLPGGLPYEAFDLDDARKALDAAQRIVDMVERLL